MSKCVELGPSDLAVGTTFGAPEGCGGGGCRGGGGGGGGGGGWRNDVDAIVRFLFVTETGSSMSQFLPLA
jgi:hypothetical protein